MATIKQKKADILNNDKLSCKNPKFVEVLYKWQNNFNSWLNRNYGVS